MFALPIESWQNRSRSAPQVVCPNQPTQTLKGFHNSAVCRTPSAFIDNQPPNPGCAARPEALLLKSFGLSLGRAGSYRLRLVPTASGTLWFAVILFWPVGTGRTFESQLPTTRR